MSNLLEVKNLEKKYGKKTILKGLSFQVEKGDILGVLGPNGSGKTTLIKCITGMIRNYKGEILLDGESIGNENRDDIAYLADESFFSRNMTTSFIAKHYNRLFTNFDMEIYKELLNFMHLEEDYRIDTMSKGMREKFSLALVLARKAKLYILDEPIAGVDPLARDQIIDSILANYNPEGAVLITTHQVKDLQNLFNKALFIRDGEKILHKSVDDLIEEYEDDLDSIYKSIYSKGV